MRKIMVIITIFLFSVQSNVVSLIPQDEVVQKSHSLNGESEWITGADVSYLDQMEDHGAVYKDMGIEKDALLILKDHWFNTIRLRLWHTPSNPYCSLGNTAVIAKRVKASGLKFLLDIHYSDSWADIVQQPKPALWQNLTFPVLKDSVYQYTKKVIRILKEEDAMPDMVQIGNEIAHGMLWDDGRVGDAYHTPQQWKQFTDLIKAGIQGVKENEGPGENIRIMIHVHCGDNNGFSTWFYDNLIANGVEFDVIGLSFYTGWGSTWQQLQENMNALALRYKKDIVVAEMAYPWSLQNWDWFPNQTTETSQLQAGYDASVKGQKKYIEDLIAAVRNVPDNRGKGIIYYSPEYIPVSDNGSSWDNLTLFGPQGDLLTSIDAFAPTGFKRVTLRLNSASIPDTLGTDSFFEVRGCVNGTAPATLPDGHVLDWSENSTIEPKNAAGDYFTATFFATAQTQLQFKFWSRDMEKWGTNGWEVGNTGTNETGDMLLTVTQDTTLALHFFNGLGDKKPYDGKLWETETGSTAVWFRVYMNTHAAVQKGYTIGKVNPIIGIRGDEFNNKGPLSWGVTKVKLTRELTDKSRSGYHLFSGAAFFPKTLAGNTQKYKFFIESNGWEDQADRTFIIPASDTTLHWVYFSDSPPVQGQVNVENDPPSSAMNFSLAQNYPNPFNPVTTISYTLDKTEWAALEVYDVLGNKVRTLNADVQNAGTHHVQWNALDDNGRAVSSGLYIYRLVTGNRAQSGKMMLLK